MARASFGTTVALVVTLAAAAFAVVMPLLLLAIEPVELPPPFPSQNQRAETLAYLVAFAAILPAAVLAGRRLADRLQDPVLPALLVAALALAVIAVRVADGGVKAVLAAALVWWAGAAVVLVRPPRLPLTPRTAWAVAALLVLAAVACFARRDSISAVGLWAGALLAAAAVRLPAVRLRRPWGALADAAVVVLLLLAVPDLVIFRPEDAATDQLAAIETGIFQFHHNFLLGPANQVLHGHAMLAGTASQYGVGSIYLLGGWFQLAPIGYGTLGFLTGVMTAAWFAAGYGVVRLGGAPRAIAAGALAIAVVVLPYNLVYPVGALPQSGPLRFGLPMALLLAVVAGERFPAHARAARGAALAIVGLSAIWALEALAYTLIVYAAMAVLQALLGPRPLRRLAREALAVAIACVSAHVLLAAATLVFAGQLPDWGEYLAYLREFLLGDLGDLTYDVARWTPSLAVGAGYAASAAALAELVRRGQAAGERPALVAIAGTTAYGIALLSYFVDRSQDHILIHVALPGILTAALWLALLLRSPVPAAARTGGLAFALAVAVLLFSVAWSSIDDRFRDSALAHAAPRTLSMSDALERLWHPPPLDPAAPAGERALARHMPGEEESLVMVTPDLGLEILLRSGRVDRLLLGDAWEASFVIDEELPELAEAVDGLQPGTRMLIDQSAREFLAALSADPSLDPLDPGVRLLAPLQQWALKRIASRFGLQPVAGEDDGFTVVELSRA